MLIKKNNTFKSNQRRFKYEGTEIFFQCCSLLENSNFSNNLDYYTFKRRHDFFYSTKIRNYCILNGYKRSVISKFKMSRHAFLNKVLDGSMIGFYRSI